VRPGALRAAATSIVKLAAASKLGATALTVSWMRIVKPPPVPYTRHRRRRNMTMMIRSLNSADSRCAQLARDRSPQTAPSSERTSGSSRTPVNKAAALPACVRGRAREAREGRDANDARRIERDIFQSP